MGIEEEKNAPGNARLVTLRSCRSLFCLTAVWLGLFLASDDVSAQNNPNAYCSTGSTCNITREIEVTDGSDVDFGNRIVIVSAIMSVRSGSMTIRAAEVRIVAQGQLNGTRGDGGGSFTILTEGDIRIDGTRTGGAVQVSGLDGGSLILQSNSGRIFGAGVINGRSEGDPLGDGGTVDIVTGGSVNLTGRIDLGGGSEAAGGEIDIVADGDVTLTGLLDLQGGEDGGGSLSIDAGGTARVGQVELDGRSEFGDGGTFDLFAESAFLQGRIRARGSNVPESCGDSGDLIIDVEGLLELTGEIDVNSRRDCLAGGLDFTAGVVSLRGPVRLRAEGTDGLAGLLEVAATERIECVSNTGSIDGRGDAGGADISFEVDALEPTTESSIECDVDLTGPAGSFDIEANTNVTIGRSILVGPSRANAEPGPTTPLISIEGCTVFIRPTATLTSRGGNASNLIVARELANIAGNVQAVAGNQFRFRPGLTPMVGGIVVPAPSLIADEALQSCGFATGTPTITRTATVTRTPTQTPVPSLVCAGDCNEDGVVSVDDLVLGINVGLGSADLALCRPLDKDRNGEVDISENVTAVSNSLNDCAIRF